MKQHGKPFDGIKVFRFHTPNVVTEGIRSLLATSLGFIIVGEAEDVAAGLPLIQELRPDLILCAHSPGRFGPVQIARELSAKGLRVPLLVLTSNTDLRLIRDALEVHVSGYLWVSETSAEQLVCAILSVANGLTVFSPGVEKAISSTLVEARLPLSSTIAALTGREQEILNLMVQGYGSKEVAAHLSLSVRTIQTHTQSLFAKLGVESRFEAVTRVLTEKARAGQALP